MNAINLTREEISEITGKTRSKAQYRALLGMGVPCKLRADGVPIVCRRAYEQKMGVDITEKDKENSTEPNFEMLA